MHKHIYVHIHIHTHIYTYICIYTHTYTHIHTYIHSYTYHIFIHSSVDGNLGSFPNLAIVDSAAMNIGGACIPLHQYFCILWVST